MIIKDVDGNNIHTCSELKLQIESVTIKRNPLSAWWINKVIIGGHLSLKILYCPYCGENLEDEYNAQEKE